MGVGPTSGTLGPVSSIAGLWRRAAEPVAAHEIARGRLGDDGYARTRGVAQQAARLARMTHLPRDRRALLLSAAWLHDIGAENGPRVAARSLRAAGHERLSRIVAHRGGGALTASLRGETPLATEFPPPAGADLGLLMLLDVALVTTSLSGAPGSPAALVRGIAQVCPPGDPAIRALVAVVSRLGADEAARALVEHLSPRAVRGG